MVDHVPKPVMPEHLIRVLLKWVPRSPGSPASIETFAAAAMVSPSDAETPSQPGGLDLAGLRDRLHGNETLLWELLAIFVELEADAGRVVADMIAHGDVEGARRKAHDLKGSAANLGAIAISTSGAALEDALKAGRNVDTALARLRRDLDEGLEAIRSALANRPRGRP